MRSLPSLVAVALLAALAGCGADADLTAAGPGRQVYLQQCASCHGAQREGVGTAPAVPVERMVSLGEAEVRRVTLEGGETMAGFEGVLTDGQLDSLVGYLLTGEG